MQNQTRWVVCKTETQLAPKQENSESGIEGFLVSALTALGGYGLGKIHGYNDGQKDGFRQGHNSGFQEGYVVGQAPLLQKLETRDQEIAKLRSANQQLLSILQTAVQQRDTSEALAGIRQALHRIEKNQILFLPPMWNGLDNGNSEQN